MATERSKPTVGIVGAGIAGLAAAIALRRAGGDHANWDIEVFERSGFKSEVGAAILVGCNATRVLRKFGLDFKSLGATENLQVRMPHGKTLAPLWADDFSQVESTYGEPWLSFHRQDLHNGLREMATREDYPGTPARMRVSSEVVDIDPDEGVIVLKSGEKVQKDLVIVSSGVHCTFVEKVTGTASPVIKTGRSCFRALVPISKIMEDPLTAPLWKDQSPGLYGPNIPPPGGPGGPGGPPGPGKSDAVPAAKVGDAIAPGTAMPAKPAEGPGPGSSNICGGYPCRSNTVMNLTYLYPTRPEDMDNDTWNKPVSIEEVDAVTTNFHPAIQALPRMAGNLGSYNMLFRKEIDTFVKGKCLLLGDAAHPMLTFHAQGASQAIESAGAVSIFFPSSLPPSEIEERLKVFNDFRHPRCVTAQIMSNVSPGPAAYPDMEKRVRKYYDGALPPATSKPWSQPFRDFFFKYDVFEEGNKFLEAKA